MTGFLYPRSGVLWRDGQMVDLSAETGQRIIEARGVNNAGHVVGTCLRSAQRAVAYLYRDGVVTQLDVLGADQHDARAINEVGQICGSYVVSDGAPARAYLWQDGAAIDLGELPGPVQSLRAEALNDAGVVVGTSTVVDPDAQHRSAHAFVWTAGAMHDMNQLIDGERDGWVLRQALAINTRGQIVGQGRRNGVPRAFLATPVA